MRAALAIGGAAGLALGAGSISDSHISFAIAAAAVLGFWLLLESLNKGESTDVTR
jgi:hypothetical protein